MGGWVGGWVDEWRVEVGGPRVVGGRRWTVGRGQCAWDGGRVGGGGGIRKLERAEGWGGDLNR